MTKASTKSKNKYNAKAYDQIPLRVKKGARDKIKEHAAAMGKATSEYIKELIKQDSGIEL